ncbi:hypothetical protein [Zoogloea sp. 1C4]|jgi:hypothetical protein|uniref:hypothetical protein n=1 Tax=Zoogloea sp. 1C4 TaxID=2570190 RepID=UPI001291733E|nr:hypothetical protein [Zoogloea sp. 1C4]
MEDGLVSQGGNAFGQSGPANQMGRVFGRVGLSNHLIGDPHGLGQGLQPNQEDGDGYGI